jgi:hypothetical protein
MSSHRFAFAALALACVAAAAGGSYLATRQNVSEQGAVTLDARTAPPVAAPVDSLTQAAPTAAPPAKTVPETAQRSAPQVARMAPAARGAAANARDAQLPTRDRTGSAGAPAAPQEPSTTSSPLVPADQPAPIARQDEPAALEPARAPEPDKAPEKTFEEMMIAADSVIGLQLDTTATTERARVEDRVEAHVVRDVRVGGRVAIPSGAHVLGSVMVVERGGKFKEQARIGIRFHTLLFADGTRLPITTETIYRSGEAPGNASAAKIGGGAVGGAILGALLGGAKGAAIGAAAGAGGGAAVAAAGDRSEATFAAGTQVTARFSAPLTVTIEK